MSVSQNLEKLKASVPEDVVVVAVSKTKPDDMIMEAYDSGHKIFGENKVQDLVAKYERLPKDIEWHMIGHLQRNKVKYIAPFVSLIHGVDSLKLLKEINKQGKKEKRVMNCLLQIKIAKEDSKFGLDAKEAENILTSGSLEDLNFVKICGLMGMATFTSDEDQIKKEFDYLSSTFRNFKLIDSSNSEMKILSMGMSGDYKIAIDCGSNMIRVGSSIFGERN